MRRGPAQPNRRRRHAGRLDHPARAADRIAFGSDFGIRFAVFVDVEEEFDWTRPRTRDQFSVDTVRHLPEFQRLMDAHGVAPTYLIDWPVADSVDAVRVLAPIAGEARCTIGAQLHSWVNPPFDEDLTVSNSFAGNLPRETEGAKLAALTEQIARAFGFRPVVHRSGRYGVGPHTAELLEEAGYLMDVSVRPAFDYRPEGGPDFSRHDSRPHWAGAERSLIEVPLGVAYTGRFRRAGPALFPKAAKRRGLGGVLARTRALSRVALTPEGMPVADVRAAIDALLEDGARLLSFSFHSPSLAPGHTPYVRDSADLNELYSWWDKILAHLARRHVTPVAPQEIIDRAWASREDEVSLSAQGNSGASGPVAQR